MKEASTPPASEIEWLAVYNRNSKIYGVMVLAKTWFNARAQAMCHFHCGPNELIVFSPQFVKEGSL